MRKFILIATALSILTFCASARSARVILKDGRVIEGDILDKSPNSVFLKDNLGIKLEIPMGAIERIDDQPQAQPPTPMAMPELVLQTGHSNEVRAVAFSPDGTMLATGGADNAIKLWNADTGELVRTLRGHTYFISTLAFTLDGSLLLSSAQDNTVKVWPIHTRVAERTIQITGYKATFGPDGKTFAFAADDKTVRIHSLETGDLVRIVPDAADPIAYSPDGMMLATASAAGSGHAIRIHSLKTGGVVMTLEGHSDYISAMAFSPKSELVITASQDRTIRFWSAQTGNHLRTINMPDAIQTLAVSRDGELIAAGLWSGHIPVISAATGGILHTIEAHESLISDIAFSPDGQFIATASWDFTAKVLSAADGALVRDFKGHASEVNAAAVNPQGSLVATGGYNSPTVKLWSLETGKLKALLPGHTGTVSCAAFSPDGKILATGSWDGAIALRPMTEDAPSRMLKGHDRAVETLAFSHRGDILASAGIDGTIFLWNTLTGEWIGSLRGDSDFIYSVAFSPDDRFLASGGGDTISNVLIWSLETGEVVRTLKHSNKISSVAFSPDGKTLASATSFDKEIFLWSVATGERIGELKGNTDSIFGIAYAPDGTMLASAGVDHAVRIWSFPSGKLLRTMEGHADLVNTVAFSPGGRLLVSGGRDAATKIWNTETGQLLATLMAFEDGNWFATDPAGRFDCSNCAAGGRDSGKQYIRWRAGNALYEPDQFFRKFWEPGLIAKTLQAGRVEPIRGLDQVVATMPPEISIIGRKGALRSPAVARERTHTVTIQVRDLGGGAQNVELTCQGRPVSAEARDITPENAPPGVRTYSFSVDLSPGMNRLVARAYSRSGIPSRDMYGEMFVSYEPDRQPPMDLYLLTVGINEYKNASSNLMLAAPDADGFRDAVMARSAGLFQEIHATELRNDRATRDNLRGALDAIQSSAGVNDTVVIYLAGHGTTIPAGWVFITHEITQWDNEFLAENALSDLELKGFLEGLKSRRVALILDACQSGEMVFAMRGADEKTLVDLGRSMGVYIFAASTDTQYAYEDKGLGHGVFTYALLQGLNGEADGLGGSRSGTVEAEELKSFTRSKVPELMKKLYGVEQYPVTYGMSYGGVDGLGPTLAEVK